MTHLPTGPLRSFVTFTLFFFSLAAPATTVLKVGEDSQTIEVSEKDVGEWVPEDKVCVYKKEEELICGTVIDIRDEVGIVKLLRAEPAVVPGDKVRRYIIEDYEFSAIRMGPEFGINLAGLSQATAPASPPSSRLGVMLGYAVEWRFSATVGMQNTLRFIQRGMTTATGVRLKLDYVELAPQLKLSLGGETTRFVLMAGPEMGFMVNAIATKDGSPDSNLTSYFSGLHLGFTGGGGVQAEISDTAAFYLMVRYSMGMNNIVRTPAGETSVTSAKHNGIQLAAGVLMAM